MNFTNVVEGIGGELKSVYGIRVKMHLPVKRSRLSSFRGALETQVYAFPKLFTSPPWDRPIALPLRPRIFDTMQFNFNISLVLRTAGGRDTEGATLEKSRAGERDGKRGDATGECNDEPRSTKTSERPVSQ